MADKPIPSPVYRKIICKMVEQYQPKMIVEVGAYNCDLTRMMLKQECVEKIFVVDPWTWPNKFSQNHMDEIAEQVARWSKTEPRVRIYRLPSHEGSFLFEDQSVDFLHIDGKHKYETVQDDIACWVPKMKSSGVMSGDNYEFWGVNKAVDQVFGTDIELKGTNLDTGMSRIWMIQSDDWRQYDAGVPHGR
jgi:hypothetical protein